MSTTVKGAVPKGPCGSEYLDTLCSGVVQWAYFTSWSNFTREAAGGAQADSMRYAVRVASSVHFWKSNIFNLGKTKYSEGTLSVIYFRPRCSLCSLSMKKRNCYPVVTATLIKYFI